MTNELSDEEYTLTDEELDELIGRQGNLTPDETMEYHCEVCDRKEVLTEAEAYQAGWDYPPFVGLWGVVSPRTCPDCLIDQTAYWHVLTVGSEGLSEKHRATITRILGERLVVPE